MSSSPHQTSAPAAQRTAKRRVVRFIAGLLCFSVAATACTPEQRQDLSTYSTQLAPIVLELVAGVGVSLAPGVQIAALVGSFAVGELIDEIFEEEQVTYLLINQEIRGKTKTTVFEIETDRALKVEMEGRFEQIVEVNRVTITPDPEVTSSIIVSDLLSGDQLYTDGVLPIGGDRPGVTLVDLDDGRLIRLPLANSESDFGDPDLKGIREDGFDFLWRQSEEGSAESTTNDVVLSGWGLDRPPSLEECQEAILANPIDDLANSEVEATGYCILTDEKRHGYLTTDDEANVEYILWVQSSERPWIVGSGSAY